MQKDIVQFVKKIHSLGFLVKLDTNGSFPERLREIISSGNVDYIAMDIKNSPAKYSLTAGVKDDCKEIFESINLIMNSGVRYEFRTTVVGELHTVEDIKEIANIISGADGYFLQSFKDSGDVICSGYSAPDEQILHEMRAVAAPFVRDCQIRGV